MAAKHTLTDLQMKAMNAIHRTMLTMSGGRLGNTVGSMPVVELHTTGRTSGKRRSTMLTTPIRDDGTFVLVASKGGDDRDPDWYRNLVADPEIELTVDGATIALTARVASDEEKAELWPRIVEAYKGYAGYQRRTDRNIPVVICEPRSA
ncbi:MAG TPA: nitroreductase family deazaflavin-dependent oxidoreductase [Ilumatobacteraceae bacterium]|nr:nitroreductase family deazaflavin-dependent oxidoreductase [Ilumatobacteraceae bacterium]